MYWRKVSGLVLPVFIAGHPALDFCNTRAGWGEEAPKEYLHTYDHLAVWTREAGLLPASWVSELRRASATAPDAGARILRRALAFRDAFYEVCLDPGRGPSWNILAAEARRAAASSELVPLAGRGVWKLRRDAGPVLPLLAVAHSAAELVASSAIETIGSCPGHGCGWLFLNPSGRRRWCSMAGCGNRAKARRHARRARTSRSGA